MCFSEVILEYKGQLIANSRGLPLYIAGDLNYRAHIDSLYKKKLIIVGKDHSKYMNSLNSLTEAPWDIILTTLVYQGGSKFSKRNENTGSLRSIIDQINKPQLGDSAIIRYIKLYFLKYEKRDVLEVDSLVSAKEMKELFQLSPVEKSEEFELKDLPNVVDSPLIKLWANLQGILHNIVVKKDLNKIYKLLEQFNSLYKEETDHKVKKLHQILLENYFNFLGL